MQFVVNGWFSDEDIAWVRQRYPKSEVDVATIGTQQYIEYTLNRKGVSVHDAYAFYENETMSLRVLHKYGGVCGAQSKVRVAICQSRGIPAMPVAQPGHCAILWRQLTNGRWMLTNQTATLAQTSQHFGIFQPWRLLTKASWTVLAKEICLKDLNGYIESLLRMFVANKNSK